MFISVFTHLKICMSEKHNGSLELDLRDKEKDCDFKLWMVAVKIVSICKQIRI